MMNITHLYPWFRLDSFNAFIILAIALFSVLTLLYSWRFMQGRGALAQYYLYIILTIVAAIAAALSNNLILLLVFWGFLGLTLYLLINMGAGDASLVAKKTFIIIGGSDALMLLGIGIVYYLSGSLQMDKISLRLDNGLAIFAYICIAIACFAKAGAMPFHSWVPDCAQSAPVPVVAFLPASLDKLLGIYLLARISLGLFAMNNAMSIFLMIIGAFTIIAAVMMALIQHNAKRLLGYHAVSQVGYMILGIGTGNPIGVAGGLFHMLNNSIYKSCLFLTSGNVESHTKTSELDKLGGLARIMPLTYISALVASISISGIPPFNGFVSKWMIYQGIITQLGVSGFGLRLTCILSLAAAMFGSALTLASFMKLIHATFLGQSYVHHRQPTRHEVSWAMWLPCIILAALCAIFGIFANEIPLRYFIVPAIGQIAFIGTWYAGLSALLIIIGLALGLVFFKFSGLKPALRHDVSFTGGEPVALEPQESRVTGTEFYNTVRELGILKSIYKKAEMGLFDIYEQGKNITFGISKILQYLHNGVLPTYLVWMLLGTLALFIILFK